MIAAALIVLVCFQISPELRQAVDAGLKAKQSGDLETAVREFQKVVKLAPNLAAAHMNLGAVYHDKQDFTNAIPSLRRALELNPDLPGARGMLGASLLAQGYAADAIPHLEKTQSNELLGVALLEAGREREAVDRLEAALVAKPNDPDLLYYLAQAHARLTKQVFDKVVTGTDDSPRQHQMLAEAHAAAGRRELAVKEFAIALSLRPALRGVHLALGELALEAGDFETAAKEFGEETKLAPGSAVAAYKFGLVLLNRGDTSAALRELRRSNTLKADMPETLLELGKAELAGGSPPAAEKLLLRLLEVESGTVQAEAAHFQLSQVYRRLGRATDAEREAKLFRELRSKRER